MYYLTKEKFVKKAVQSGRSYWIKGIHRWDYIGYVVECLKQLKPSTVLELGTGGISLVIFSDIMEKTQKGIDKENLNNKLYIQDATMTPWDIPDKYYDVFVALQVFEHLKDKQVPVFKEVMRISKNAILSFPYKWKSCNEIHDSIDDVIIEKWTCGIVPVSVKEISFSKNKRNRIVYVFKF